MSTEKETAKKAAAEKKKGTDQITDSGEKVEDTAPNEKQVNELINSYYEAVESYFEETGSLPEKGLKNHEIYDKIERLKEEKEIAEMKRLEEIEANKPKTFAVTDGKQVINVTEATFKYLGKEWKKAPRVPKEVQELKEEK